MQAAQNQPRPTRRSPKARQKRPRIPDCTASRPRSRRCGSNSRRSDAIGRKAETGLVIPAQAGIPGATAMPLPWTPAFAGVTGGDASVKTMIRLDDGELVALDGPDRRGWRSIEPRAIERRAAEIVTLHQPDAFAPQDRRVFRGGNAFGHGGEAKPLRKSEEVPQENLVFRIAREIADERAVDLYGIDGQALQVT